MKKPRCTPIGWRVPRHWEVGRRIEAAVAPNGRRAVYGQQVLERLAADIDMRLRLLYEMVSLFRLFPALPTSTHLGWSHYRVLLRVGPVAVLGGSW